ncbi:MAG TPA: hypothetical protein VE978_07010 [Chitinophagales bacterium]|nr:hypothetical protein [Chitinophagales bacterium]
MEHFKGETFSLNLGRLTRNFKKAIREIEESFDRNSVKLKDIAKINSKGQAVLKKAYLIREFDLVKNIYSHKKYRDDVKGLYVFASSKRNGKLHLEYVGISKTLFKRLKDHAYGKTRYMATLVYLMASHDHEKRGMKKKTFKLENYREEVQAKIRNWRIALYPIKDSFELYMTEPYLAYHWKARWNSFETH